MTKDRMVQKGDIKHIKKDIYKMCFKIWIT